MKRALLALVVVLLAVIGIASFVARQVWFMQPRADAAEVAVVVEPNMTATFIREALVSAGVMDRSAPFIAYVKATGAAGKLKAGTFALKPGMSVADIVRTLTEATSSERRITLLEGWGIREMGEYLVVQGVLKNAEEWYAVVGTPPSVAGQDRQTHGSLPYDDIVAHVPSGNALEGFMFPDTYRVAMDASAEDIARTMLANFERRVLPEYEAYQRRDDRYFTGVGGADPLYDIVILASIVEREVRGDADRKMVADLFLRRMEEGMALQADSTVNYVTGKKTPSLSIADRDIDSPWNTYQHRGLPPTPISNPSLSAIKAVLDPTPNPYVYFLTDAEGTVHYARTFEEHIANKNRYLR